MFGGSLPCDPGRKLFDLVKNHPGIRGGVGGEGERAVKFGPNDKRY